MTKEFLKIVPLATSKKLSVGNGQWLSYFFLSQGTTRFGELSRKLPQMTQANLTKELRMLEEYGLIHREVYREVPPKVEYSLTDIGRKFLPVIEALGIWALEYEQQNNG